MEGVKSEGQHDIPSNKTVHKVANIYTYTYKIEEIEINEKRSMTTSTRDKYIHRDKRQQ